MLRREVPVVERTQHLFLLKTLLEEHIDEIACVITNACGKTKAESVGELRRGIDEQMIRQPLGVVAAGNCFILKPSEKVPMTSAKLFELIEQAGFPPGVVPLVNRDRETVDALLDHPASAP